MTQCFERVRLYETFSTKETVRIPTKLNSEQDFHVIIFLLNEPTVNKVRSFFLQRRPARIYRDKQKVRTKFMSCSYRTVQWLPIALVKFTRSDKIKSHFTKLFKKIASVHHDVMPRSGRQSPTRVHHHQQPPLSHRAPYASRRDAKSGARLPHVTPTTRAASNVTGWQRRRESRHSPSVSCVHSCA